MKLDSKIVEESTEGFAATTRLLVEITRLAGGIQTSVKGRVPGPL